MPKPATETELLKEEVTEPELAKEPALKPEVAKDSRKAKKNQKLNPKHIHYNFLQKYKSANISWSF